jgi:predicted transcriptional regulator
MCKILRIQILLGLLVIYTIFTQHFAQMPNDSKIAAIIKERRQDLSLSQQDLSEMSQVALRTINALESGRASINLKKLSAIVDVLGLELNLDLKKLRPE